MTTSPDWSRADLHRDEHARLKTASDHVARAVAELIHAAQLVGDHATAVALSEAVESLQLTQAHLASAAERAFALAEIARRGARQAAFQRQFDEANQAGTSPGDDAAR